MKHWNDMTPDERAVGVLTKVCGWEPYMASGEVVFADKAAGNYELHAPPILTDATACTKHVGKALEEKGCVYRYSNWEGGRLDIMRQATNDVIATADVDSSLPDNERLATALAEAAYRMATEGEE